MFLISRAMHWCLQVKKHRIQDSALDKPKKQNQTELLQFPELGPAAKKCRTTE